MILFIVVLSGVLGLYGYLWNTLRVSFAKTIAKDFYLENTQVACSSNSDCASVCAGGTSLGSGEACICLKSMCYYLKGSQHFSQAKFCEQDSDCTVSCYEGPVSMAYYEKAGAAQNDCSGGCADSAVMETNGAPNPIVCRNRQCQYRDGRTCYTGTMPGASL